MNFEDWQKAWQAQDAKVPVTLNAEVLLKTVRRNQQQFRATILRRDLREVGVAWLLTAFFSYRGLRQGDWTDVLVGVACFGVGTFLVVDRWLQRRKQTTAKDPLKCCLEASLHQVKHQIWLLQNVFWWYLLPIAAALAIFFGHAAWRARPSGASAVMGALLGALLVGVLYWGIYWLNRVAVRKSLEPRRRELEELLASLDEPRH